MSGSENESTAHLDAHRSVILFRSALIGAATAAPAVGEMLVPALQRGLIHHVLGLWHLDIEDGAVEELIAVGPKAQSLSALSVVGGLLAVLRRTGRLRRLRRLFVGFTVLRGLEETSRAFHLATVLDHYCARHSVGAVIRPNDARRLRDAADRAVAAAQRETGSRVAETLVNEGLKLIQAIPTWALTKLGKAQAAGSLPQVAEVVAETRAALRDVSARRYLASVVNSFDKKWSEATP